MKKNNAARALRGFITLLAIVTWLPNALGGRMAAAELAVLIDSSVLREALAE